MKSWLHDNDIKMHSTHNEGKLVVAERFIRTLKIKIYKHMTTVSKYVDIDKPDELAGKYYNTYHRIIKIKPVNVKSGTYIDNGVEYNDKDPKFKVGIHNTISKYINIFAKGYTAKWSEEVFVIKKVNNIVLWTYAISVSMLKKLLEHFMKKSCKRKARKNSGLKK